MKKQPYIITEINGIKTVLYPIKDIPAILAEVMIKAGSWYESAEKWGAFHFIEHLCHQGTQTMPTSLDQELFKEDHGLSGNAYTGGERVGFWVKGPDYSLDAIFEFLSQTTYFPLLEETHFAREISVIEQEYHGKWDSPFRRFDLSVDENLWGKGYPYLRDGMGQPEYIKTLKRDDLLNLHREYFTAQNSLMAVIGNFDVDKLLAIAHEKMVPPVGAVKHYQLPTKNPGGFLNIHHEDVAQNRISQIWQTSGRDSLSMRQRLAINIGMYLFGGTAHSVLFQELREKRGLVYSTGSHFSLYPTEGLIEIYAATNPNQSKEVIELSQRLFKDFLEKPLEDKTFKRAKKFLNATTMINFDSLSQISGSVISNFFYEGKVYLPAELIREANPITAEEVQATLKSLINNNKPHISVMTKEKTLALESL